MNPRRDSDNDIRWVDVKNVSGEVIPRESVVMVTRAVNADKLIEVDKPDADNISPAMLMFTNALEIPVDGEGAATHDWPARCTCDELGGENYGTGADSWELKIDGDGFQAWGTAPLEEGESEEPLSQLFAADSTVGTGGGSGSGGSGDCAGNEGLDPSDFIQCVDGEVYIRPGRIVICNGAPMFIPS